MKKQWLITAALLATVSTTAFANSNPTPATPALAPLPEAASPAPMAPAASTSAMPPVSSPAPMDPAPMAPAATPPSETTPAPATTSPASSAPVPAETKGTKKYHEYTLDEARKKAHEKADKLDKMTEDEWKAQQKKKHDHYVMWKHMTPEEKAEYKKAHPWHRKDGTSGTTTAPAAATPGAGGQ